MVIAVIKYTINDESNWHDLNLVNQQAKQLGG